MNEILFYLLLQLLLLFVAGNLSQNASSQNDDPILRFGVFISQELSDSNSFEYAGFLPSLKIGFETVKGSSVLTRETDGRKYDIMYNISDAMVCTKDTYIRSYTRYVLDELETPPQSL